MKKLTIEEIQERIPDFQVIEYKGYDDYLKIRCSTCGKELEYKVAKNFLRKPKCSKCSGYNKNNDDWIEEAKAIHGNKYSYDKTNYINNKTDVEIYCNRCQKYFWQNPRVHLISCGHICYKKDILSDKRKYNTETFTKKMEEKYPEKYVYDRVNYIDAKTKVEIFCKRCNEYFWQQPDKLLFGFGHFGCSLERSIETRKVSVEDFIERSIKKHGDEYSYDKVEFDKISDKVLIFCKRCNEYFPQTASDHLKGSGCPYCSKSRGEKIIRKYLNDKKIAFIQNKEFDNLIDEGKLSYDFYIEKDNILIEFNGIQHYEFIPYFHKTLHNFHKQLHHDWMKRKYAIKNKFNYLVISYKDDLIKILNKSLGS